MSLCFGEQSMEQMLIGTSIQSTFTMVKMLMLSSKTTR